MVDNPDNIIGGLVSGVATGLVLAVFFWVVDRLKRYSERKGQIKYLVDLISRYRQSMHKPTDEIDQSMQSYAGKPLFREVTYNQMKERILSALDGRCSRLSFDEIQELRGNVEITSKISELWDEGKKEGWSDEFCNVIFGRLENIKWLNLPKEPSFLGSSAARNDDD